LWLNRNPEIKTQKESGLKSGSSSTKKGREGKKTLTIRRRKKESLTEKKKTVSSGNGKRNKLRRNRLKATKCRVGGPIW